MTADRLRDLAGAQSDLARRLDALERLIRRLKAEPGTADAARLAKLQEAIADLAGAQHDAHLRLDALTGAVDRLAGGRAGDETPEGGSGDGRAIPASPPRPIAFETDSPRGWRPRLKRWARFVLRSTLGKVRWIWDAAHPRPPWGDVRLLVRDAPGTLPSLTIVAEEGDAGEIRAWLEGQTDRDTSVATAGESIAGDYAWHAGPGTVGGALADLPATFVESARLLLASEALGFVCFETPRGSRWLVGRELRRANGKLDLDALARRAKRRPGVVLGKIAGGDPDLLPRALCRPEIRRRLRRDGPYVVAVATKPRVVKHRLSKPPHPNPLPQGEREPDSEGLAPEGRSLLLLTAALAGGRERAAAAALDGHRDAPRIVASTVAQDDWRGRWRALERSTPYVYALGGVFADELHADLVHALIVRHGVERLVYFDDGEPPPIIGELSRRSAELRIDPLRPVVKTPEVAAGDGGRLRDALGWPADAVVVVMCADLIPEQRPEDFVALAHRLRDDERFRFLLVGAGPLASGVRDLGRLLDLENLRVERPERNLGDVLDAADVVCSTAERDLFPHAVPAALLLGRPAIAAAGDLRRLLETGPCGLVVDRPGDLDGFEEALRSLTDADRRRRLGERGADSVRAFYQAIDD